MRAQPDQTATEAGPAPGRPPARMWLVLPASVLLPWLGAAVAGKVPSSLFAFPPPVEIPIVYERFSWWAAGAIVLALLALLVPWMRRRPPGAAVAADEPLPRARMNAFPAWGWMAILWTAAWWVLAWTRFPWMAAVQRYTFFPLWLGFIVAVNALVVARGGRPTMMRAPGLWLTLFGASALFWWLFEWLNRFVANWHYPIIAEVGAVEYALHGSLCFSTVLPAVTAVRESLGTFAGLQRRLAAGPAWRWLDARQLTAAIVIAAGVAGLVSTGAFPAVMYPALWLAPLLLAGGLGLSAGWNGGWRGLTDGDWREAASWAMAALVCGLFWELWNAHSLARWLYTVPFVERWHVFEMPLLGYTGYLPFGIECGLAVAALAAAWERRHPGRG